MMQVTDGETEGAVAPVPPAVEEAMREATRAYVWLQEVMPVESQRVVAYALARVGYKLVLAVHPETKRLTYAAVPAWAETLRRGFGGVEA